MNEAFQQILGRLSAGEDLTRDEMSAAIGTVMRGEADNESIGLLLTTLAAKGETVDEVAGAAAAMRTFMTPIRSRHRRLLDTCGTGGGGSKIFNVSTTAALVLAACGVPVAKHGNRSVTSRSGSADVLESLGVNIDASIPQVERCLDETGVCFCFARSLHPAMRHVAPVRKQLGIRTIFNILGPLSNPAGASHQLLGAGRPELRPLLADALAQLGIERAMVVSGADGLGEITITGPTHVTEVVGDRTRELEFHPEQFGISVSDLSAIEVASPGESAAMVRQVLAGESGPMRDIVMINSAAGLMLYEDINDPRAATARVAEAIDSQAAARLLQQLAEISHAPIPS